MDAGRFGTLLINRNRINVRNKIRDRKTDGQTPDSCCTLSAMDTASVMQRWIRACVQLPTYADNVAPPAFARRTPLLLSAGRAAIDQYLPPVGPTAANLQ